MVSLAALPFLEQSRSSLVLSTWRSKPSTQEFCQGSHVIHRQLGSRFPATVPSFSGLCTHVSQGVGLGLARIGHVTSVCRRLPSRHGFASRIYATGHKDWRGNCPGAGRSPKVELGCARDAHGKALAAAAATAGPTSSEEEKGMDGILPYKSIGDIDKAVLLNTFTCSAAAISDPVMSLVDTLFVGKLGTVELASLGPNASIFNAIFFMMSLTGAIVTTELIGTAYALDDIQGVQRGLIVSVVLATVVGLLSAAGVLLWSRELLLCMGTNDEMMGPAMDYLRVRALAVPASLLLIVAQACYRAVLDLKTPCLVVLAAGICNAILDPIFMFHANLGVAGAAIATSISQWAGVVLFAYLMTKNKTFTGGVWRAKDGPNGRRTAFSFIPRWPALSDYMDYLKGCSALGVRAFIIIATNTVAGIVATRMGTTVAASHQLLNQLHLFQMTVLWAVLEVGQSMVVNALGRGGRRAARAVGNRVILWGAMAAILMTWGTWAVRIPFPRIFIQDEAVLDLVRSAMAPCCAMILLGWNNAIEGVLIGAGDMKFVIQVFLPSTGISILMLIFAMCSHGALPFGGALPFVWWALTLCNAILTLTYCCRYWMIPPFKGLLL